MEQAEEQQAGGRSSYNQEMQSFTAALACLALLYILMPRLPWGLPRLLLLFPCLPIFLWVPFSTRLHFFRAILSFMFLWVCPSKLLLLCWEEHSGPRHGFFSFAASVVLPIRVKDSKPAHVKGRKPTSAHTRKGAFLPPLIHFLCFLAVLNVLRYRESLSAWAIHALYCLLVYFGLQGVLGVLAELAYVLLGVESYPFFDKPFLASSLSDFWSHRWNLVATYMLRETVYAPILRLLSSRDLQQYTAVKRTSKRETVKQSVSYAKTPGFETSVLTSSNAKGTLTRTILTSSGSVCSGGTHHTSNLNDAMLQQESAMDEGGNIENQNKRKPPLPARAIAMFMSFLASGLIHELIFCCINQANATWEVTMFFLLHGFATLLEVFLRRKFPARQKLPEPVAILCTLGFLFFTAAWLFMPPVTRAGSDLRIIAEFTHMQNAIMHLFKSQ